MTTQIFKDYAEFVKRLDKKINGVSPAFAENNAEFLSDNETNLGCWNCRSCRYCRDCLSCRYCIDCTDCSDCRDCRYCSYCLSCRHCSYCSSCRDCLSCSDCSYCIDCSDCRDCRYCSLNENTTGSLSVPIIENIHSKISAAIGDGACNLNMESWHCGTTHCRAGWVVTLAGEEGKQLESETDTCFAAMMIYKKSSPEIHVPPTRFFESDEAALADIVRCAELETAK